MFEGMRSQPATHRTIFPSPASHFAGNLLDSREVQQLVDMALCFHEEVVTTLWCCHTMELMMLQLLGSHPLVAALSARSKLNTEELVLGLLWNCTAQFTQPILNVQFFFFAKID